VGPSFNVVKDFVESNEKMNLVLKGTLSSSRHVMRESTCDCEGKVAH
jgi:hypothetical protein